MEMNASTDIARSPEVVYGFVSEPANDVRWRTGVTDAGLITGPPLAVGSEGFASAGTKTSRWKVTGIVPGSQVDWELTEGPIKGTGGYRIDDVGGKTRFTLLADVEPAGLLRLLGPVFRRVGSRQNQADVEKLKAILEAEPIAR